MKMPSVMRGGHAFSQVPQATIERSQFDRSHGHKTTFDGGYLIPIFVDEALPGDTFHVNTSGFVRMTTPLKPLMDNLYIDTFFFAVPYRLVWANWQKFNGEQVNPGDSTVFTIPVLSGFVCATGSLSDYLGVPLGKGNNVFYVSSLWHRAYNLIYNQWFRDENLINSATVDTGDGPDNIANYVLRRRGKRHDYFTSCLPWPQKGVAVSIPLGTVADVVGKDALTVTGLTSGRWGNVNPTAGAPSSNLQTIGVGGAANFTMNENLRMGNTTTRTIGGTTYYPGTGIFADLSNATAATINSLRQAFQIQKMLERDARGGTRYTEIVKSHFGVTSPDARLQRPEYLGGGSTPIMVQPIPQQSASNAQPTPQGNLAAIATGAFRGHGFVKSFTEHCLLLGIACVRADLTYQQGLERMFSRSTRYDFYWPALAHIGEQAVLQGEIFYDSTATPSAVFGYQERYAEYRYKPSRISGKFRSDAAGTVDIWHLSQKFLATPTLNQTFIEETPPIDRVVAVTTEPQFYADFWFNFKAARPMPVFSVPGLIDHF